MSFEWKRCLCPGVPAAGSECATGGGGDIGGHRYHRHVTSVTFSCSNGCGCVMGRFNSRGPDGVDPTGECPKEPW